MEITSKDYLELRDRRILHITGVKNVINYCEYSITLEMSETQLSVEGDGLSITKLNLDDGEVDVEGLVYSMTYSDGEVKKSGVMSRLFG